MKISVIAITGWRVQGAIHSDTKLGGDVSGEAESQRGSFIGIQFARQRDNDFAREHSIVSTVVYLNSVPEHFAVAHEPATRQVNARVKHAVAAAVIKDLAGALIGDQCAAAIRRRRSCRSAASASNGRPGAQMKNSHLQFLRGVGAKP